MRQLKPSEIFFSQDSISNTFRSDTSHGNKLIGDTLDQLLAGTINVKNIPPITVAEKYGKVFTGDNRRLWVFRKAEILGDLKEIEVYNGSSSIFYAGRRTKFTTQNGGSSVRVRGDPGGRLWKKLEQQYNAKEQHSMFKVPERVQNPPVINLRSESTISLSCAKEYESWNISKSGASSPNTHGNAFSNNRVNTKTRYKDEVQTKTGVIGANLSFYGARIPKTGVSTKSEIRSTFCGVSSNEDTKEPINRTFSDTTNKLVSSQNLYPRYFGKVNDDATTTGLRPTPTEETIESQTESLEFPRYKTLNNTIGDATYTALQTSKISTHAEEGKTLFSKMQRSQSTKSPNEGFEKLVIFKTMSQADVAPASSIDISVQPSRITRKISPKGDFKYHNENVYKSKNLKLKTEKCECVDSPEAANISRKLREMTTYEQCKYPVIQEDKSIIKGNYFTSDDNAERRSRISVKKPDARGIFRCRVGSDTPKIRESPIAVISHAGREDYRFLQTATTTIGKNVDTQDDIKKPTMPAPYVFRSDIHVSRNSNRQTMKEANNDDDFQNRQTVQLEMECNDGIDNKTHNGISTRSTTNERVDENIIDKPLKDTSVLFDNTVSRYPSRKPLEKPTTNKRSFSDKTKIREPLLSCCDTTEADNQYTDTFTSDAIESVTFEKESIESTLKGRIWQSYDNKPERRQTTNDIESVNSENQSTRYTVSSVPQSIRDNVSFGKADIKSKTERRNEMHSQTTLKTTDVKENIISEYQSNRDSISSENQSIKPKPKRMVDKTFDKPESEIHSLTHFKTTNVRESVSIDKLSNRKCVDSAGNQSHRKSVTPGNQSIQQKTGTRLLSPEKRIRTNSKIPNATESVTSGSFHPIYENVGPERRSCTPNRTNDASVGFKYQSYREFFSAGYQSIRDRVSPGTASIKTTEKCVSSTNDNIDGLRHTLTPNKKFPSVKSVKSGSQSINTITKGHISSYNENAEPLGRISTPIKITDDRESVSSENQCISSRNQIKRVSVSPENLSIKTTTERRIPSSCENEDTDRHIFTPMKESETRIGFSFRNQSIRDSFRIGNQINSKRSIFEDQHNIYRFSSGNESIKSTTNRNIHSSYDNVEEKCLGLTTKTMINAEENISQEDESYKSTRKGHVSPSTDILWSSRLCPKPIKKTEARENSEDATLMNKSTESIKSKNLTCKPKEITHKRCVDYRYFSNIHTMQDHTMNFNCYSLSTQHFGKESEIPRKCAVTTRNISSGNRTDNSFEEGYDIALSAQFDSNDFSQKSRQKTLSKERVNQQSEHNESFDEFCERTKSKDINFKHIVTNPSNGNVVSNGKSKKPKMSKFVAVSGDVTLHKSKSNSSTKKTYDEESVYCRHYCSSNDNVEPLRHNIDLKRADN